MVFPLYVLIILIHPLQVLAHSKCQDSFNCGKIGSLGFPFSLMPECGIVSVDCASPLPVIRLGAEWPVLELHNKISENKYRVKNVNLSHRLEEKSCLAFFAFEHELAFKNPSISLSVTANPNITLASCSKTLPNETVHKYFHGFKNLTCDGFIYFYRDSPNALQFPSPDGCELVHMPVKPHPTTGIVDLFERILPEYEVEWHVSADCASCHHRGGMCLTENNNLFWCKETKPKTSISLVSAISASATFLGLCFVASFLVYCCKKKTNGTYFIKKQMTKTHNAVELFVNDYTNIATRRYKYSDLKKITNSFTHELGRGGFGCVYKGKLPDDQRLVAVKILSKLTEGGEEFINEVASISRTSHVNIVTLLGYCIEGSKRALIYEFMPNGSLEKFIQHKTASPQGQLDWGKLSNIAIGTARGLEYLHQGCNMRILHFDIKPHNILLDMDFTPKISDFGLAKLCPNRSSVVSMIAARGTIGYIAPEVFCRNFGGVSHKSDVYSYGMMVLEMALGREKVDRRVDESSEMYFPDWIYKHLKLNSGVGFPERLRNEDEWTFGRKMIIVGLWCIQTEPRNRPSMSRVVEMLGGSVDCLEVPPMPYLVLPPIPPPDDSSANATEGLSSIGSM